jgi:hypothetical protein
MEQNTTQVDNRLNRARATYVRLLHISSMIGGGGGDNNLWSCISPSQMIGGDGMKLDYICSGMCECECEQS